MNVLLSIHPRHALEILEGRKCWEYRKAVFKSNNIDKVYIYATAPTKRVVGEFKVAMIICDTPQRIWEQTHEESGVTKDEFISYFQGVTKAYAIRIKDVVKYDHPITLSCRPPQNFMYVDKL